MSQLQISDRNCIAKYILHKFNIKSSFSKHFQLKKKKKRGIEKNGN